MPLDLSLISVYTGALLSLDDAKVHLKVPADDSTENDYIMALVTAATRWIEKITGRCQAKDVAYRQMLDGFPCPTEARPRPAIRLDRGPVKAVTKFAYIDYGGNEQLLTEPEGYILEKRCVPAYLKPPRSTQSWPVDAIAPEAGAVVIEFTASVETDGGGNATPDPLAVQACRLLLAHMFENREAGDVGRVSQDFRDRLIAFLGPIRVSQFG